MVVAEVAILGDYDSILGVGPPGDLDVGGSVSLGQPRRVDNIMACRGQTAH